MTNLNVTRATLGRLPDYLDYLKNMPQEEYPNVSSGKIARALGLGEVQVRKDLQAVSGNGRPKTGYTITRLIRDIEEVMGAGNPCEAVLVGAGKLGTALLGYHGFGAYGVNIVAAFDAHVEKTARALTEIPVYPIDQVSTYCAERSVTIGIITVSANAAQEVCDELVNGGIKAILNFAPVQLKVPEDVIVRNENLALSLAHLRLQHMRREEEEE